MYATPQYVYNLALVGNEARRNYDDQLALDKLTTLFFLSQRRPTVLVNPGIEEKEYYWVMGNGFRNLSSIGRNFDGYDKQLIRECAYFFLSKALDNIGSEREDNYRRLIFVNFLDKLMEENWGEAYFTNTLKQTIQGDRREIQHLHPLNALELIIFYHAVKMGDYIKNWPKGKYGENGQPRVDKVRHIIKERGYEHITSEEMAFEYVETLNEVLLNRLSWFCTGVLIKTKQ